MISESWESGLQKMPCVRRARERDAVRGDHHDGDARTHAEREGEKVSGHVAAFLAGVRAPCLWCVCCID